MSSILGIFGNISQGVTEKKMADANAKLMLRQMFYETQKTKQDIEQIQEETVRAKSTQLAKIGASGVKTEGSPLEMLMETERRSNEVITNMKKWQYIKNIETVEAASMMRKAGTYSMIGSMMSGASTGAKYGYGVAQSGGGLFTPTGGGEITKNPISGSYSTTPTTGGNFNWALLA